MTDSLNCYFSLYRYSEEWSDTSTKLGWSEVDYIHHHFFGDDDENKDGVSYKTTQNRRDISTTGSGLSLLRSSTRDSPSAAETRNSRGLLSGVGTPSITDHQDNDEGSSNNDEVGGMTHFSSYTQVRDTTENIERQVSDKSSGFY